MRESVHLVDHSYVNTEHFNKNFCLTETLFSSEYYIETVLYRDSVI